jgi:hypothetical protein
MAYQGLSETHLAKMAIGLRTPDYESQLPYMLNTTEQDLRSNPHYLGWAWHSTMTPSNTATITVIV